MRAFHPGRLTKTDYKASVQVDPPTLCDIHFLVLVSQLAGCQLIYPPPLTSAEEEMEQTAQNLFPLIPPQQWIPLFYCGLRLKGFRYWV